MLIIYRYRLLLNSWHKRSAAIFPRNKNTHQQKSHATPADRMAWRAQKYLYMYGLTVSRPAAVVIIDSEFLEIN